MRKEQFEVGHYYHIYNRGVADTDIFRKEGDYRRFFQALFVFNDIDSSVHLLRKLRQHTDEAITKELSFSEIYKILSELSSDKREPLVNILSYYFMPNHYHLELKEVKKSGISIFLHRLGTGYTNYFNKKYDRQGALFQGPFKAVLIKNDFYLQHLSVYINALNPLDLVEPGWRENGIKNLKKAKEFIENYKWSSYPDYIGLRKDNKVIEKNILGELFSSAQKYKSFTEEYLEGKQDIDTLEGLTLE